MYRLDTGGKVERWNNRPAEEALQKQIAELEKRVEACRLANHLLEQERNELEAERDRLRKALRGLMQAVDGCLTPHEALLWKKCEEAMKRSEK